MIESDAENDEIREVMPDLPAFYITNARTRAKKREAAKVSVPAVQPAQPITELAKQFDALANLQKTMRENDAALIAGLRAEFEAAEPAADDTDSDKILDAFLEVVKQKMQQPAAAAGPQPALELAQKPIPPAGAVKKNQLSDEEILGIVDSQVPRWVLKLIKAGKIEKKNAFAWLVGDRGVEAALFERAWKLIR